MQYCREKYIFRSSEDGIWLLNKFNLISLNWLLNFSLCIYISIAASIRHCGDDNQANDAVDHAKQLTTRVLSVLAVTVCVYVCVCFGVCVPMAFGRLVGGGAWSAAVELPNYL